MHDPPRVLAHGDHSVSACFLPSLAPHGRFRTSRSTSNLNRARVPGCAAPSAFPAARNLAGVSSCRMGIESGLPTAMIDFSLQSIVPLWPVVLISALAAKTVLSWRSKPPSAEVALEIGHVRSCLASESEGLVHIENGKQVHTSSIAAALESVVQEQIASGRQVGIQVSVYFKGREIANVCGGAYRDVNNNNQWRPVEPDTLFMPFSTVKGVSGAALLSAVDDGKCDYSDPVIRVWKEFGAGGKEHMTISDAVSHRGGLARLSLWVALVNVANGFSGGWKRGWKAGLRFIEQYIPDWEPGTMAKYHYVSFSWIIGGIVERAYGQHIHDVVAHRVAAPLGVSGDMYMGRLPENQWGRTAQLEVPRAYLTPKSDAEATLSSKLKQRAAALIESLIFVGFGNSAAWRRMCLPSSNGFFTATAIARMYGALCNKGALATGERLVSAGAVERLVRDCADASLYVPTIGKDKLARPGRGFSPWHNEAVHGEDMSVLCHNGMGGCVGFGLPESGLAVAVMKNAYEPFALAGSSLTPDGVEIVRCVTDQLGLQPAPADTAQIAPRTGTT